MVLRVAGGVTEAEVRAWCQERLSAYKQPSEVEIVDCLGGAQRGAGLARHRPACPAAPWAAGRR